jgi:hypothetical protein
MEMYKCLRHYILDHQDCFQTTQFFCRTGALWAPSDSRRQVRAEPAKTTCDGTVLVLGCDETGKPRAAWFPAGQAELATKAANLMGLIVCPVSSPELAEIGKKLPAGRLYANGRGFVPHIRRDLYAKVLEAAGLPDQKP